MGDIRGAGGAALVVALTLAGCSVPPGPVSVPAPSPSVVSTAPRERCTTRFRPAEEAGLRTRQHAVPGPEGELELVPALIAEPTRPIVGRTSWRWAPSDRLPAPEGSRPVDVFYTPHPDDETLSMSTSITSAVRRGDRVILVALSDGGNTKARAAINQRLGPGTPPLTVDQVATARARELLDAAADLGVPPTDVVPAHLDAESSDCGAVITVAEAMAVMRAMAARFPGARHVTMSYVAERHPDHLDAGEALRRLVAARVITPAEWTVSRLWWGVAGPEGTWRIPDPRDVERIRLAAGEYHRWDPAHGSYAVGWVSVPDQFAALGLDPRDRVHGLGATPRAAPR